MEQEKKVEIPAQVQELHAYIDSLFEDVDVEMGKSTFWMKIEFTALIGMLIGIFVHPIMHEVLWLAWFAVFVYRAAFLGPKVSGLMGEIDGCFKTLEILGFMDKGTWTKRKRRTLKDLFEPMVKAWTELKTKAQEKLWGPGVAIPAPAMSVIK